MKSVAHAITLLRFREIEDWETTKQESNSFFHVFIFFRHLAAKVIEREGFELLREVKYLLPYSSI